MIVMHGLLGSKVNWKGICGHRNILQKRDCYLMEMRNHATSDHHQDHNYKVMSDDIMRFADQNGFDQFTVLGHSMGGRVAMTLACRFPDRLDAAISIDAAPVD
jgi:esterase